MIAGLTLEDMQRCFDERVKLNPGARTLVSTMNAAGARCVLVSGGFDFFTSRVAQAAGFHSHWGNKLIDDGEALTGRVVEPILGRDAKLQRAEGRGGRLRLLDGRDAGGRRRGQRRRHDRRPPASASPTAPSRCWRDEADAQLEHTDLTSLLYFQGYGADRFVTG